MELHELKKNEGATFSKKRVGRGPGSGLGKTSGRGENGQKSRSGGKVRTLFEGGQTPLFRKFHQRGFTNARFKVEYAIINLDDLNKFDNDAVITPELLKEMGLLKNQLDGVKVLGNGTLEKKLTVKANKFSKKAQTEIEKLGGKVEVI